MRANERHAVHSDGAGGTMHIVFLLIFVPMLLAGMWMIAIQLPFGLISEGTTNGSAGSIVAGIIVFVVIRGGGFALLAH